MDMYTFFSFFFVIGCSLSEQQVENWSAGQVIFLFSIIVGICQPCDKVTQTDCQAAQLDLSFVRRLITMATFPLY